MIIIKNVSILRSDVIIDHDGQYDLLCLTYARRYHCCITDRWVLSRYLISVRSYGVVHLSSLLDTCLDNVANVTDDWIYLNRHSILHRKLDSLFPNLHLTITNCLAWLKHINLSPIYRDVDNSLPPTEVYSFKSENYKKTLKLNVTLRLSKIY